MAPDAEECETARLNAGYEVPTHHGRRVLPERAPPARAWTVNESSAERSPGENKRLLPTESQKPKSRLQSGLTLGVHFNYPEKQLSSKVAQKTKFQKRKEKLIEVLKPPYFILSMIVLIIGIHLFGSEDLRATLEWSPTQWRQEPWRLLTYGLVHANATHLALNALVALAVGWRLEREQGWWRAVCVWTGGVAAGALGAGALQPHVRVVGASAAVYALLTAHLPNVFLRFGHIPLWWFRPLSVVVLGASEGCWALIRASPESLTGSPPAYEHVAWAAHVLGAAVGVPLAFVVFTGENEKKALMLAARVVSALVLISGLLAAALYYSLWAGADD